MNETLAKRKSEKYSRMASDIFDDMVKCKDKRLNEQLDIARHHLANVANGYLRLATPK